jgi:Flp pilus assembly protein TadG
VVAVEFALVLPLLLLLVLGGIDWGYYFFAGEIVANAAREGARAGSLERGVVDCSDTGTAHVTAANYMVRGRLVNDPASADARLKSVVCTIDPAQTGVANGVKVTVVYAAKPAGAGSMSLTGFLPAALLPRTVTASATMRLEP